MELSNILELIHAVSDSNLTEFNLQDGNLNISMSTEKTIVQQVAASADTASFAAGYQPTVQPTLQAAAQNQKDTDTDRADDTQKLTGNIVKSPLVGTYYAASSPDSAPFVKVGDKVSKGQVLGIVEAMKLMNEIESEFDGTVKEILVENEQMVEFGQPMFVIE
jgi:acetyl-CoA carboxylase biotin carboxyl carrier protein